MLIGFICLVGASLLEAVSNFRKRWAAIQQELILSGEKFQRSSDELIVTVNRMREEQEQTNRLLEWLGEIQQEKNQDSN